MFKRARWMATGLALGFGGSLWVQRKVKSAASRYAPAGVAAATVARARDAVAEGRVAMREREEQLRASGSASLRRASAVPGPARRRASAVPGPARRRGLSPGGSA